VKTSPIKLLAFLHIPLSYGEILTQLGMKLDEMINTATWDGGTGQEDLSIF